VFPTAYQVATVDLATLRTAGLSGRKAEYGAYSCQAQPRRSCSYIISVVRDLGTRFADGRLTNQKLLDANDEELFEMLTAVYGIGKVS
jgi:DNA-3-methyladenine glycosylase II